MHTQPTRRNLLGAATAMSAAAALTAATEPAKRPQAISLAAWSFSGSFFQGKWKLLELPGILHDKLGITALEHVNQFFENPSLSYLAKLNKACADNGVKSTILMVDGEGGTASPDPAERKRAAIAHRKWFDIGYELGCYAVRCNVYGGPAANWQADKDLVSRAAETMHAILDYGKASGLDLIVENHGGASSDPEVLVPLVKKVNHPKFGLLCDLGNWNKGDDRYANSKKILPYAKGLSVKGTWGPQLDPTFDAEKLVKLALDHGYSGWWGLEVTPRRAPGGQRPPVEQQFAEEVKTVLEAKAIVERVVLKKG